MNTPGGPVAGRSPPKGAAKVEATGPTAEARLKEAWKGVGALPSLEAVGFKEAAPSFYKLVEEYAEAKGVDPWIALANVLSCASAVVGPGLICVRDWQVKFPLILWTLVGAVSGCGKSPMTTAVRAVASRLEKHINDARGVVLGKTRIKSLILGSASTYTYIYIIKYIN